MEQDGPLEEAGASVVDDDPTVSHESLRPELDIGHFDDEHLVSGRRRTQKTAERIAGDIVQEIVSRHLRTGDRLPLESAMLGHYGVSRSSLREALRLLEVQGLIHLKPGPGGGPVAGTVEPAYLARTAALFFFLGSATYDDLIRTQLLLEPLCARLAATNPRRAAVLESYLTPSGAGDELTYRHETSHFHALVYELADNWVLSLLTQAVSHLVTDHVVATMDPVELRPAILVEHAALARVIVSGRPDEAGDLMADHFASQHEYYRRHWPDELQKLIEWR